PIPSRPRLEDAVIRVLGADMPPQPAHLVVEDLFHGSNNCELVQVEASLLGITATTSGFVSLTLQAGSRVLSASLPASFRDKSLPALQPGSQLRLAGISMFGGAPGFEPAVSMLLRSPGDLQVIGLPPHGSQTGIFSAVAILAGIALGAALWLVQKQRRAT